MYVLCDVCVHILPVYKKPWFLVLTVIILLLHCIFQTVFFLTRKITQVTYW